MVVLIVVAYLYLFSKLFGARGTPSSVSLSSPRFLFTLVVIMMYLFVLDESLTS